MYAITFFTLLEQSLRWDGYNYSMLSQISALPYMKKEDAKQVLERFKKMAEPEAERPTNITQDRKRLRQILLGRRILK